MTELTQENETNGWIDYIIRDVAELPDRTSPEDFPEAMLVTADELQEIIESRMPLSSGWIDSEKQKPPLVQGQDFSENVWGWDGHNILVVSFFIDSDGSFWGNAYGDVFGDAEFDDNYDIKFWQPIAIPEPPNMED